VNPSSLLDRDDPPILGANPLVGLTRTQVAAALARLARHAAVDPALVLATGLRSGADLADVTVGRSGVQPARGDKRFAHPAWAHNPIYRRLMQAYLVDATAAASHRGTSRSHGTQRRRFLRGFVEDHQ